MRKSSNNRRILFFMLLLVCLTSFFSFRNNTKQTISLRTNLGDTTAFTVNTAEGWGLYNSYIDNIGDSIQFEMILYRNNPGTYNWNANSDAGTIDSAYAPSSTRIIEYLQLPRSWRITIKPNGNCSFKLLDGPEPQGSPFILPVQTRFKK